MFEIMYFSGIIIMVVLFLWWPTLSCKLGIHKWRVLKGDPSNTHPIIVCARCQELKEYQKCKVCGIKLPYYNSWGWPLPPICPKCYRERGY